MSLIGDTSRLTRLGKALRGLPIKVAQTVAARGAPDLTAQARASFRAGESVYGDPRPAKKDGSAMTLNRTGRLFSGVKFTSVGTRVRAILGASYAKYFIRYGILPRGGAKIPAAWAEALNEHVRKAIAEGLR